MELLNTNIYNSELDCLPNKKILINTINAHSYNIAQNDHFFAEALKSSDVLLPDGVSIVIAKKVLLGKKIKKVAGADLFYYEMNRMNKIGGKCFFLGSSQPILDQIFEKAKMEYPNITISVYSPPFVKEFSGTDNRKMIQVVNDFKPDVLFIGMTAPKQEKWAHMHFEELNSGHICCIGAVFDFYAGSVARAPDWLINLGLEWFYRFVKEPKRLWRRYILGNFKFVLYLLREFYHLKKLQ